jgi:AAA ATPase domain
VPAWQVLRSSGVESRFEALHGSALTRLIGRDEEIDLLLRRWARAKAGDGQVVLFSGEAGIGKSRVTAELAERLRAEPHIRLRYFCSPYHQDSALFPFIDQLGRASGFARDNPPTSKLEKIEALLACAEPPDEDLALLAELMSLPASERHPLPNLSPQRKKERTLEALIRQLEGLARRQPVASVLEDAHWIDPTSRELLDLTVERVRSLPVLLIVTFRPEFQSPWTGQPQVTMLALNRLDRHDRARLVEQIAGGKALPDEVIDQIVDRTDGVPLFVEELTKSVLESGLLREEVDHFVLDRTLPPFAIPATLHDSLRRGSIACCRCGRWRRSAPRSDASFPTRCCTQSPALPSTTCKRLSAALSPPSWCPREARRPTRSIRSSTRWCRTRRIAACYAVPGSSCTRRSPMRSRPIPQE